MTNQALAKLYEIPKTLKDKKDTTGNKDLAELYHKTKDPVFLKAINYRSYGTIINNYIPNWEPDNNGRVHTQWGFTAASGQLDSRSPNILNISKHTKTGQRFRRIIVAPSGYCFCEFDKKSFHVATLGYLANDKDYLRFSQLDPHSIFTSYIMPSSWGRPISFNESDKEILGRCKEIKSRSKREKEKTGIDLRQDTAKPCVLGNQLGLGPRKLAYQNRRAIKGEGHARELQQMLANLFPKVETWKNSIIEKADRETYLVDEWGKVQFFYEVYRWQRDKFTGRWRRMRTNEAEKVLAFRVQGVAFGMLKWESLRMEERGYNERYNFINTIHDSLVFMPTDTDRDTCICNIGQIMNSPCPILKNDETGLEGLVVKADVAIGRNMANYNEESNPEGMR